jgi:hypothetical protein
MLNSIIYIISNLDNIWISYVICMFNIVDLVWTSIPSKEQSDPCPIMSQSIRPQSKSESISDCWCICITGEWFPYVLGFLIHRWVTCVSIGGRWMDLEKPQFLDRWVRLPWFLDRSMGHVSFWIDRWMEPGWWIQKTHIFSKNTKGMGQENPHFWDIFETWPPFYSSTTWYWDEIWPGGGWWGADLTGLVRIW